MSTLRIWTGDIRALWNQLQYRVNRNFACLPSLPDMSTDDVSLPVIMMVASDAYRAPATPANRSRRGIEAGWAFDAFSDCTTYARYGVYKGV